MSLDEIRRQIPDHAKDLRLNLGSVLSEAGAPGLSQTQIWGAALASALASGNRSFSEAIQALAAETVDEKQIEAAHSAAAIMGMNNVYYRFIHLVGNDEYGKLPARLRMNVIGNPGVPKVDFELYSLAVSAVNGCGLCVESHERQLRKHGLGAEAIQSAVRIAAVVNAVGRVLAAPQAAA